MLISFGEVEALDKVPEQFRPFYVQDGEKFKLGEQFTGAANAFVSLNQSLQAARDGEKGKLEKALQPLSEFGTDVESIKAGFNTKLKELQDQIAKGGDAKLNLEKVRAEMADAHAKDIQKHTARTEALQAQLHKLLVDNAATMAVAEAKGVPELLLPFVRNNVKVVEEDGQFNVYVIDQAGDRRYSGVTGQPMTIKELVGEMKTNPLYGRLFESDQPAGGAGFRPGAGGGKGPGPQPQNLTATQKIAAGLNKGQYKKT